MVQLAPVAQAQLALQAVLAVAACRSFSQGRLSLAGWANGHRHNPIATCLNVNRHGRLLVGWTALYSQQRPLPQFGIHLSPHSAASLFSSSSQLRFFCQELSFHSSLLTWPSVKTVKANFHPVSPRSPIT
jgi:hypothetical protein